MKVNDLISSFEIQMSNEEKQVYNMLESPQYYSNFPERTQFVLDSLIRKSLVSKVRHGNNILVARND